MPFPVDRAIAAAPTLLMLMKCDHCDNEAVVHEVLIKHGTKREVHLCAEHAAAQGYLIQPQKSPIAQVFTQLVVSQSPASKSGGTAPSSRSCPGCGLTFTQFRRSGVLGCPDCYDAFTSELGSLIERAHAGATHHAGKTPRRAGGSLDQQMQIRRLVRELDRAVAAEQYERAASIRDQLLHLDPMREQDPPSSERSGGATGESSEGGCSS